MPLLIPYTFRTAGKGTPLNRLDGNFTAIATYINVRTATVGPRASRPAAGHAGALYIASDQHFAWYLDDGATWHAVGGMGMAGAITVNPATGNVRFFGADAGTDGQRVLTGQRGTAPTTSPPDVAQLWIEDKQTQNGAANWTTRSESDGVRPVDPTLFGTVGLVSGFTSVGGTGEQTIGSWTVAGGTLIARALEVALRYDVTVPTARTLTLRVKLGPGPTTLATVALALPILTGGQGLLTVQIEAITAAIQRAAIQHVVVVPAPTSLTLTTTDGALDASLNLALTVSAQWSGTGATLNAYALTVRLI
jgi:hypothetical protein